MGLVIAGALRAWVTAAPFENGRHLSVARRGGRLIRIHLANHIRRSRSDGVARRLAGLSQ